GKPYPSASAGLARTKQVVSLARRRLSAATAPFVRILAALLLAVVAVGRPLPADAASIGEFGVSPGASPRQLALGSDGNIWFTEFGLNKIGRITTTGSVTEFALPAGSQPLGITSGPDGALWFTESGTNKIGQITTAGTITEFNVPTGAGLPNAITTGPDGALWFTEQSANKIGRITTAGVFTEFPIPTGNSQPMSITAGPDGALWFTEQLGNQIGRITTVGALTEYGLAAGRGPIAITVGSDGALWFTQAGENLIGRITIAGAVTEFSSGGPATGGKYIVSGPGGDLFFTQLSNTISHMSTLGVIKGVYNVPTPVSVPVGIAVGPDNHIWFVQQNTGIGRLNLEPVANDDSYTAQSGVPLSKNVANGVLSNDGDPENDTRTATLVQGPANGGLVFSSDGSFTYTAGSSFSGSDSFTYKAVDNGSELSNTATVHLTVVEVKHLAVTAVKLARPMPGAPFTVTVKSLNSSNQPSNVTAPTTVTLTKKSSSGAGSLGTGPLSGVIPAGQNTVTITGVIYDQNDTNVVLTATASNGDLLSAGDTAPFVVSSIPLNLIVTTTLDQVDAHVGDGSCNINTPPTRLVEAAADSFASLSDTPVCSLRAAVQEANQSGAGAIIKLQNLTYQLTIAPNGATPVQNDDSSGDLNIYTWATIVRDSPTRLVDSDGDGFAAQGSPLAPAIIQAGTSATNGVDRVFRVAAGASLTLNSITVQYGKAHGMGGTTFGGGINTAGGLTLNDSKVLSSASEQGQRYRRRSARRRHL
ncbi:MAG: Ig-like domain-containing protein, partial [Chloroflexi bacterium]|nr:Ig-like domain-containing protein [Chloroflexota bacterium]